MTICNSRWHIQEYKAGRQGGSVPPAVPASYKPKKVNGAPVPPDNHPELDIEVD